MTFSKYKRLFLVSLPVLILFGFLTSLYAPYPKSYGMMCDAVGEKSFCYFVRSYNDKWHRIYKSRASNWFYATFNPKPFMGPSWMEITARSLPIVKITKTKEYYPLGRGSFMNKLSGHVVNVHFMNLRETELRSQISDNGEIDLTCNQLSFMGETHLFEATCSAPDWNGVVTFNGPIKLEEFDDLKRSIGGVINEMKLDYLSYCLVIYPMYLYLFFFASLLSYLTTKSYKYVRAG